MKYKTISSDSLEDFEKQLNDNNIEGWKLHSFNILYAGFHVTIYAVLEMPYE